MGVGVGVGVGTTQQTPDPPQLKLDGTRPRLHGERGIHCPPFSTQGGMGVGVGRFGQQ